MKKIIRITELDNKKDEFTNGKNFRWLYPKVNNEEQEANKFIDSWDVLPQQYNNCTDFYINSIQYFTNQIKKDIKQEQLPQFYKDIFKNNKEIISERDYEQFHFYLEYKEQKAIIDEFRSSKSKDNETKDNKKKIPKIENEEYINELMKILREKPDNSEEERHYIEMRDAYFTNIDNMNSDKIEESEKKFYDARKEYIKFLADNKYFIKIDFQVISSAFYVKLKNIPYYIDRHSSNPMKAKSIYTFIKHISETDELKISNEIINAIKQLVVKFEKNDKDINKNDKGGTIKNTMNVQEELKKLIEKDIYQIILTGAPGTGKTYSALEFVKKQTEDNKKYYKMVQFHTSYDYSDFVEGLRPIVVEKENNNLFVRLDGVFKHFCRTIVENNIKKITNGDITIDNINIYNEQIKGKKSDTNINEEDEETDGKRYYFIIDEINRADLSKVFGELMFGLEESYRGVKYNFDTQYKNLPTYRINEKGVAEKITADCFKDGFYIPKNLILIGTMNDIDRSVETFDFALRRRFRWIEVKANEVMEEVILNIICGDIKKSNNEDKKKAIDISDKAKDLNKVISSEEGRKLGLNELFHIGPAYYKLKNNSNELQTIWDTRIESILREYCRGRDLKKVESFMADCAQALGVNYKGTSISENKEE